MKLTALIILVACLTASANGFSQITLSEKNTPLQQVLKIIERQSGYEFLCPLDLLQKAGTVSVELKNVSLEDAVKKILDGKSLTYTISEKTVVIREKVVQQPSNLNNEFPPSPPINISGRVTDSTGQGLENVTVLVKGTNNATRTDADGFFTLKNVPEDATIQLSLIGFQPLTIGVDNRTSFNNLVLKFKPGQIENVIVKGSTGYQVIDKNHPGSFDVIDKKLLNRSVSSDILTRIQNLTPGIIFGAEQAADNPYGILIRGRNTIFSSTAPLIVLDNFIYDGDLRNINPNDVESVTILKDAAAAAQWGARAGNGVIVITTKRGQSAKPRVEMQTNFQFSGRPDLSKLPLISSSDYIDLERWLFDQGFYDADINNSLRNPPLSPVTEILLDQRNGLLSQQQADDLINPLRGIDSRKDIQDYFYQDALTQRSSISVSGNGRGVNYYMSAGYDRNPSNLKGNLSNRITLNTKNSFRVSDKMNIDLGVKFMETATTSNGNPATGISHGYGHSLLPYADLVDEAGNALRIVKDTRIGYYESLNAPLDWSYRPYDEINYNTIKTTTRTILMNAGISYRIIPNLEINAGYSLTSESSINSRLNKVESYAARNLINSFYQPTASNKYPVPIGGIINGQTNEIAAHQGRLQANYYRAFGLKHALSVIAGWEIRGTVSKGVYNNTLYGFQEVGNTVNNLIDFTTFYPQFSFGQNANSELRQIPTPGGGVNRSRDRILSSYINALYKFGEKYAVSVSAREDAANLLGVKANQRGNPLWSVGGNWSIHNEKFWKTKWLEQLNLRMTYGYTGNFSRLTAGVGTIRYPSNSNLVGLPFAEINNPPNGNLRWEKKRTLNVGLDFAIIGRRISGTIEYHNEHIKDLMAEGPADPTSGLSSQTAGPVTYFGNVANMRGNGVELTLNTNNINGGFKWNTTFNFTYVLNKVSKYFLPPPPTSLGYVGIEGSITPIVGKPIYTMYSWQWAGLDPQTGDPRGYLGKDITNDYLAIQNQTILDSLIYHGPVQAPVYGAIMNSFAYKNLSLSFNISYALGYFFRREHLSYFTLYRDWTGHSDYTKRWQKPGDENITNVPSRVYTSYPQFGNRDNFYHYSSINVLRGDHFKLNDLSVAYQFLKGRGKAKFFENLSLTSYVGNLNILLWTANKENIDPGNRGGRISKPTFALGLNVTL